jgi:DNA polymerase III subunit epsilon
MINHATARRNAIVTARAEVAGQPVYLDTETTGLEDNAEIVDICIVDHDGTVLVDSLVKPRGRIPPDATAIHGITNAMVRDAPAWPELWPQIEPILAGRRVAIYNADFDVRLLKQTHQRCRLPWQVDPLSHFCVMRLYAQFHGDWNSRYNSYRWQRLEQAILQCRISGLSEAAHRARADAIAARAVLHHMAGQAH